MSKLRKWMMKEEQQRDSTTSSGSGDSASSSAIKLFGKTIAVSGDATKAVSEEGDGASTQLEVSETGGSNAGVSENLAMGEVERKEKVAVVVQEVSDDVVVGEKKGLVEKVSNPVEKKVQQPQQQRALTVEERKEQCLKKPDKLIPCPRCESVDTKFCYYNNYNINQPRHFCKSCQRYWTAGGTLRNVLVGAGRRKNKYGVAQQQHHAKQDGENTSPAAAMVVRMDSHEPAQRSTPAAPTIIPPSIMNAYGVVPPPMKHAPVPSAAPPCESAVASAPPCFPVFSAFKPTGAETSSDSISKLRQRTRPDPPSGESSISSPPTPADTTTYVLTPRAPQPDVAASLWTRPGTATTTASPGAAAPPLGFFNGAWPYGYNIGWTGAPPQHPVVAAAAAAAAAAAPPMWTGMWTSQVPAFGWNMLQGGWSLPWRPVPVVGVQMQQPTPLSRKRDSPTAPPEETRAKAPRVSEEVEA